jgi:hypothetical protein
VKNQLQQQLAMMDQAESRPMPIQFAGVSAMLSLSLICFISSQLVITFMV